MTTLLYSFHPVAEKQQIEIWLYTHERWGVAQADKYIDGLHDQLVKIAQDFSLLRSMPSELIAGVKFFHYGRHYVFIKEAALELPENIQVLTILHDNMDIPVKLNELLGKF